MISPFAVDPVVQDLALLLVICVRRFKIYVVENFLVMCQIDESEKLSKLATVDLSNIFPNKKVLHPPQTLIS